MKRLSWKYIAGFIDGEGCLDMNVNHGIYIRPRLRIAQANVGRFILESLQASFSGTLQDRISTNDNWSDSTSWELVGYTKACPFLRNVTNHLEIKQQQARFLLWTEGTLKGKVVSPEIINIVKDELKAMKRDPHRLSDLAQERLISLL